MTQCLKDAPGSFVAASDYMKVLPESIASGCPDNCSRLAPTDLVEAKAGQLLRDFFEVDAKHIVLATLTALAARKARLKPEDLQREASPRISNDSNPDKLNPAQIS